MRKVILPGIIGMLTAFSAVCSAQMSTFPAPPPLPPRASAPGSDQATNSAPANLAPVNTSATQPDDGNTPSGTAANAAVPVTAATLTSMNALDDKSTLSPGDRISFRVIEDRDEAVPRVVTDTGEVDFPYVGRVKVQGQTCRQVANKLKQLLEVDYYKSATVIVGLDVIADHGDTVVPKDQAWVMGQVRTVGPVEISKQQPLTVSQIIMKAGGFGDFADQRKVRLVHRRSLPSNARPDAMEVTSSGEGEIIDVKAVFEGKSASDPIVAPNDYIIVPKRLVNF